MAADQAKDKIENVIGPTASLKGDLICEGGVRIDGVFVGRVESQGNVIIGEAAKVEAEIKGNNVSVAGAVKGNINALGRLEILSGGQVMGDITVDSFVVDEGGVFAGEVIMENQPAIAEAKVEKRK